MNTQFTIESVQVDRSRAYVRAAIVNPQDFAVIDGSTLGGVRVSTKEFREPQPGIFVFRLEDASDAEKFRVGDAVTLINP
jgi:hypothetical protein